MARASPFGRREAAEETTVLATPEERPIRRRPAAIAHLIFDPLAGHVFAKIDFRFKETLFLIVQGNCFSSASLISSGGSYLVV